MRWVRGAHSVAPVTLTIEKTKISVPSPSVSFTTVTGTVMDGTPGAKLAVPKPPTKSRPAVAVSPVTP